MSVKIRQKRAHRFIRRTALVALLLGLTGLTALWLTFQHKPGWYRPAVLDSAGLRRARRDATNTMDFIGDQIVRGEPFDLTLSERSVNEWLAALPHVWPEAARQLGTEFTDLAVDFYAGVVRVGGHFSSKGVRVIASVGLILEKTDDGRYLRIALIGAHGGSLPLPHVVLESLLERLLRHARAMKRDPHATANPLIRALGEAESCEDLFLGLRVGNRFIWPNGRRAFRIADIEISDDLIRLRIEPL